MSRCRATFRGHRCGQPSGHTAPHREHELRLPSGGVLRWGPRTLLPAQRRLILRVFLRGEPVATVAYAADLEVGEVEDVLRCEMVLAKKGRRR